MLYELKKVYFLGLEPLPEYKDARENFEANRRSWRYKEKQGLIKSIYYILSIYIPL